MKVVAFTVCVLLICTSGLSIAQITFHRSWVRGDHRSPGDQEDGGEQDADFNKRETKSLRSPFPGNYKVLSPSALNQLMEYIILNKLQQEENEKKLKLPIPYSQWGHTNYVNVK